MSLANLMLNLELGLDNRHLIRVGGQLADRFDANLTGIVACTPITMPYGDGYINGDLLKEEMDRAKTEISALEVEFRSLLSERANRLVWRSSSLCSSIADFVANEAVSADVLLVASSEHIESASTRHMNNADVLLQLGRPMLLIPRELTDIRLQVIMIAWKDTMESRRAIYDALPFLKYAHQVILMEIVDKDELELIRTKHQLVIEWLALHQIKADSLIINATGDDTESLRKTTSEMKIDLLIAGAYGHSRLREWVIGGMTREIMRSQSYCSFISH